MRVQAGAASATKKPPHEREPDLLVFDLDPGPPATIVECCRVAEALRPLLGSTVPGAVVAPAIGGILVAHEVARALGCRGLFTEREGGSMTLRRGFTLGPDEPVVVVEDVITTGGSTREVVEAVGRFGARVVAAGSLVDRSGGKAEVGVARCCLLTLEVPTYTAEECPLCAAGSRPVKPGSRSVAG